MEITAKIWKSQPKYEYLNQNMDITPEIWKSRPKYEYLNENMDITTKIWKSRPKYGNQGQTPQLYFFGFSQYFANWHYQFVLSWYPHQPETHQLSFKKVSYGREEFQRTGHIDRTRDT